jgi:hypothetical protein
VHGQLGDLPGHRVPARYLAVDRRDLPRRPARWSRTAPTPSSSPTPGPTCPRCSPRSAGSVPASPSWRRSGAWSGWRRARPRTPRDSAPADTATTHTGSRPRTPASPTARPAPARRTGSCRTTRPWPSSNGTGRPAAERAAAAAPDPDLRRRERRRLVRTGARPRRPPPRRHRGVDRRGGRRPVTPHSTTAPLVSGPSPTHHPAPIKEQHVPASPAPAIHLPRGLPASGKSTLARRLAAPVPPMSPSTSTVAVCGRTARRRGTRIGPGAGGAGRVRGGGGRASGAGRDVVADRTSLNPEGLRRLEALGGRLVIHDLRHVRLADCLARDAARPPADRVGEDGIRALHRRWL